MPPLLRPRLRCAFCPFLFRGVPFSLSNELYHGHKGSRSVVIHLSREKQGSANTVEGYLGGDTIRQFAVPSHNASQYVAL